MRKDEWILLSPMRISFDCFGSPSPVEQVVTWTHGAGIGYQREVAHICPVQAWWPISALCWQKWDRYENYFFSCFTLALRFLIQMGVPSKPKASLIWFCKNRS